MARNTGASGNQQNQPNYPFYDDQDADPFASLDDPFDSDGPDGPDAPNLSVTQRGYDDSAYAEEPTPPGGVPLARSVQPLAPMSDADALATLATEDDDERALTPERFDREERRPVVSSSRWLPPESPEDEWRTNTMRAITGKQQALRPRRKRTLPAPRRFRRPSPIRSGFLLVITIVLVILGIIGSVDLGRQVYQYVHTLQHPTVVPHHQKTPKPIPTQAPTATATPAS